MIKELRDPKKKRHAETFKSRIWRTQHRPGSETIFY
jgi:hypothetical protein